MCSTCVVYVFEYMCSICMVYVQCQGGGFLLRPLSFSQATHMVVPGIDIQPDQIPNQCGNVWMFYNKVLSWLSQIAKTCWTDLQELLTTRIYSSEKSGALLLWQYFGFVGKFMWKFVFLSVTGPKAQRNKSSRPKNLEARAPYFSLLLCVSSCV